MLLRFSAIVSGIDDLAVTNLDGLDDFESIPVCVAYELDGRRLETPPVRVEDWDRIHPIFEDWPGWQKDITRVRDWADLPPNARAYLDRISTTLGVPISMVGVGPFLTIPFMVAAMNGPHVLYAWLAGLVLALADGLVYAQLGAALPGSGGGYLYLREAFRPFGLGRLMGFLFIFQTVLIAPLSVAGGAVGFADYLQYVWTSMSPIAHHTTAAVVCVAMTALLHRLERR